MHLEVRAGLQLDLYLNFGVRADYGCLLKLSCFVCSLYFWLETGRKEDNPK